MKKAAIAMIVGSVLGLTACQPQQEAEETKAVALEDAAQQEAYSIGANLGTMVESRLLAELGDQYDKALIVEGFKDALDKNSQLDEEQLQTLFMAVQTKAQEAQQAMLAKAEEENIAAGKAFLVENGTREGVVATESGLQYEVMTQGEGEQPGAQDTVKVHYRGTLLDGTEFDSSYSRGEPATFPLHRVIKGWTEGVQLMKEGSKFKFFIPSELAYGARATGKIPAHSTLIFEVELLEIVERAESSDS